MDEITDDKRYHEIFRVYGLKEPIDDNSYENVQLLEKKGVHLLSPVVEKALGREEIIRLYNKYCSHLTNKKNDTFQRPGIYDILLADIRRIWFLKPETSADCMGIRICFNNGNCTNIPDDLLIKEGLSSLKRIQDILILKRINKEWISGDKQSQNVVWPWLNKEHMDILSGIKAKIETFRPK